MRPTMPSHPISPTPPRLAPPQRDKKAYHGTVLGIWYGMMSDGTVWYCTIRYAMVWCVTVRYGPVRYGTVRYGVVCYGTVRSCTVWDGTVRYGAVQYGMDGDGMGQNGVLHNSAERLGMRLDRTEKKRRTLFTAAKSPGLCLPKRSATPA